MPGSKWVAAPSTSPRQRCSGTLRTRRSTRLAVSRYLVYGVNVESSTPLALTAGSEGGAPTVTLAPADAEWFADATRDVAVTEVAPNWYKIAQLRDGSTYVRWEEWFHFLIASDGRHVAH